MITKKNRIARIATLGLMAALVLSGTATPFMQPVTASAQTTSSASFTFMRDLTIGSTGADVTALQNWLISRGHTIPAGATGYFGVQTRTALAAYQAANGIAPAAGYFGPITRAKVAATTPVTPVNPSDPSTPSGALRGGEADLRNFDFSREESSGNEGEEEVSIATIEFDVEDGDVRIERLEIFVNRTNDSLNAQPWRYFDRIAILADGDEIADQDVDNRADWSRSGTGYELTFTGLSHVVREGDAAELTIVADISDSIDSANLSQSFTFSIPDRGIRAVDSEGIQQYIGDEDETVTFGFGAEENGDIRISRSSDNPRASILVADERRESDDYDVFAFELQNRDDADTLVTELAIGVTGLNSGVTASDVIRRATLEVGRDRFTGDVNGSTISFDDLDFEIGGDDEEEVTLTVRLARNATSTPIEFTLANADIEAEGVRSGNTASVSGSLTSELHTIAFTGIIVEPASTAQSLVIPSGDIEASYGTYTIRFDVTAIEDDIFIATTTDDTGTVGVQYEIGGSEFAGSESAWLTSTARVQNGFHIVREGDTETFTLNVVLDPSAAGTFYVRLAEVRFNESADFTDSTVYTVPSDSEYRTDPLYIAN